ncbi:DNA photolyase family protein [Candidatus Gracilibacteria bacterium]|nr:DNA photolyase family protein [Candidatus Gracilibacteria bacterium]
MHKKSIFWFRQDLRTHDNTGLHEAVQQSEALLPIFILDTHIIESFGGLSDPKFGFIREALEHIGESLKQLGGGDVLVLHGKPEELIPELIEKYDIECVFANKTYGKYGQERDEQVAKLAKCEFKSYKDFLLAEPHEVDTRKVFTPFYKLWKKVIESPQPPLLKGELGKFSQLKIDESTQAKDFITHEKHPYFTMEFGKKRVEHNITSSYEEVRNDLDKDGTSRLSPYLRFGIFSVRELYNKALQTSPPAPLLGGEGSSQKNAFISELAWREFWWHIYYNFPDTVHTEFQEKRRHIEWETDEYLFSRWCEGKTGYPVVDAAMRQLNETGWMHGRARMIVASFLTKDMHIDWRLGEKYFREKLLDFDTAVNLGNWQWSASVGADPKPLRIFNPILQSEKFDPKGIFIRKYIPELESEPIKAIHNPLENTLNYIRPIVDHREETKVARELYKGEVN